MNNIGIFDSLEQIPEGCLRRSLTYDTEIRE